MLYEPAFFLVDRLAKNTPSPSFQTRLDQGWCASRPTTASGPTSRRTAQGTKRKNGNGGGGGQRARRNARRKTSVVWFYSQKRYTSHEHLTKEAAMQSSEKERGVAQGLLARGDGCSVPTKPCRRGRETSRDGRQNIAGRLWCLASNRMQRWAWGTSTHAENRGCREPGYYVAGRRKPAAQGKHTNVPIIPRRSTALAIVTWLPTGLAGAGTRELATQRGRVRACLCCVTADREPATTAVPRATHTIAPMCPLKRTALEGA